MEWVCKERFRLCVERIDQDRTLTEDVCENGTFALANDDGCQPRRDLLLHAGRFARYARDRLGTDRKHSKYRRPRGLRLRLGILRCEARRRRPDARFGARSCNKRDNRQRGLSWLYRNRHASRKCKKNRCQDRANTRTSVSGVSVAKSAETVDPA